MASVADEIPPELMEAWRKPALIEWIRGTGLPARFKRKLLQDWGVAVGRELTAADYEAVTMGVTR